MSFPVFFDTCTLFGETTSDLFLCLAEQQLFVPYWSDGVLEELNRTLSPRIGQEKVEHRIQLMRQHFPNAEITGYEKLIETMTCDEGDKHVLAAAAYCSAETLVTFNIKDFPAESTAPLHIEIKHPDDFLLDLFDLAHGQVTQICYDIFSSYQSYPQTPEDYAIALE
ncbi:PIN domain-containing protein [Bifidobacterium sp. ESL0763]|uniref:PIN domain-containing protein n=1 Tax=Bifidobacterium sp. ESL0763 TaxID=2983227 RepID=UPI0023F74C38|nr:PIN domain-containing protein [Bifidobacterium sp. ESL0763]MDF7663548.1 PIN domain-containing protein [Bifidobacterium sp. ESL0763]